MTLKTSGMAGQIAALSVGESVSLTTRIPARSKNIDEATRRARMDLKNRIAPFVARAKRDSGGTFTAETAAALAHDYSAILVTVAVTRLSIR